MLVFSRLGLALAFAALCATGTAWGQAVIGLRPAVTIEPEYPDGAFDVNLAPLCVELPLGASKAAIRADLVCSTQFGAGAPALQNLGLLVGLSWYPFSAAGQPRSGFFVGPKAGLVRNVPGGFWSTGPGAELGWAFGLGRLVIEACAEGGATVFLYPDAPPRVAGHGGLSCVAGFRL